MEKNEENKSKKRLITSLKLLIILIIIFIIFISFVVIVASFLPHNRKSGPRNFEEHKNYSISLDIKAKYNSDEL